MHSHCQHLLHSITAWSDMTYGKMHIIYSQQDESDWSSPKSLTFISLGTVTKTQGSCELQNADPRSNRGEERWTMDWFGKTKSTWTQSKQS